MINGPAARMQIGLCLPNLHSGSLTKQMFGVSIWCAGSKVRRGTLRIQHQARLQQTNLSLCRRGHFPRSAFFIPRMALIEKNKMFPIVYYLFIQTLLRCRSYI